jgi:hypothetical protein
MAVSMARPNMPEALLERIKYQRWHRTLLNGRWEKETSTDELQRSSGRCMAEGHVFDLRVAQTQPHSLSCTFKHHVDSADDTVLVHIPLVVRIFRVRSENMSRIIRAF